jgi:AcrR family transcriptional regulator
VAQTRLSREERKEQTRADLVQAARRVFAREGFHGASVEQISLEAGYTTGAIYSRFGGKDELFLAVLDEHTERRRALYLDAALAAEDFESAIRAIARLWIGRAESEPEWTALVVEFWTHAARNETFRRAVLERNERQLAAITDLVEQLGRRHGLTSRISERNIARMNLALGRGFSLEQLVDAGTTEETELEEILVAVTLALMQ